EGEARRADLPDIRSLAREGQTLLVQVAKDPISTKGARLTTHLTLSSRYLVYMPNSRHIGISVRIEDEQERERLRQAIENAITERDVEGGFIVRTVAEGVSAEEIVADIPFLQKLWTDLTQQL